MFACSFTISLGPAGGVTAEVIGVVSIPSVENGVVVTPAAVVGKAVAVAEMAGAGETLGVATGSKILMTGEKSNRAAKRVNNHPPMTVISATITATLFPLRPPVG